MSLDFIDSDSNFSNILGGKGEMGLTLATSSNSLETEDPRSGVTVVVFTRKCVSDSTFFLRVGLGNGEPCLLIVDDAGVGFFSGDFESRRLICGVDFIGLAAVSGPSSFISLILVS